MTRTPWIVLGIAALLLLAFGASIGRSCHPKPTKAERRADTVLQDTTRFLEQRHQRDSIISVQRYEIVRLRKATKVLKDSASRVLADWDSAQARAATTALLPTGITPHDSIIRLDSALTYEKQAAARLRSDVIPVLQSVIRKDSLTMYQQDAAIAQQALALRAEWKRNDALTESLRNLRQQPKGKVLGFLPSWTDDALLMVGAGYVGYRLGQGS